MFAVLLLSGGMGFKMNKVKAAEYTPETALEEDEVLVKGEGSKRYILNKNYSIFSKELFNEVLYSRVGQEVKIWDVENDIKRDINTMKEKTVKTPQSYHLITNAERDDIVREANKQHKSIKEYLESYGIDLSKAPKHMTTANNGTNRVWHYSDSYFFMSPEATLDHKVFMRRDLFFEKFDITNNHYDNSKIGMINCMSQDRDRFTKPEDFSKNFNYIDVAYDKVNEFRGIDYLLMYVKN